MAEVPFTEEDRERFYVPDAGEHAGHRVTRIAETQRWAYSECECGAYWRYTSDAAEDRSREKHRWGEPAR